MNKIIILLAEQGLSEQVRTLCIAVAAMVALLFSLWYGTKMKMKIGQIVVFMLIAYPLDFLLLEFSMRITSWIASNHFFGIQTIVNSQSKTFVVIPLVALLVAKVIRVPWKYTADLLAIANLINYAICSLGCLFTGCCIGYPCFWGLYSPATNEKVFPIQIVNTVIMLVISILLIYRAYKRQYIPDGKQFPIMLSSFGLTRFLSEFFMDNEKIALGCSTVSLHGLFMCVVGITALMIIQYKTKQKSLS